MYRKDKEGVKERRGDIKRLWKLLHDDRVCFSESIEWFGRKAIESEEHRKFAIMFATYLEVMIKVDNRLFLGRTYWNSSPRRVDRVYRRLMSDGYAERIIELALGAIFLYTKTKHKQYAGKVEELSEAVKQYKTELAAHRYSCANGRASRRARWKMIRESNRFFAKIYDIVDNGTLLGWRGCTYTEHLAPPVPHEAGYRIALDLLEAHFHPVRHAWKQLIKSFKSLKRNKRRKINWKKV